jgi:hypothetical protein
MLQHVGILASRRRRIGRQIGRLGSPRRVELGDRLDPKERVALALRPEARRLPRDSLPDRSRARIGHDEAHFA